jgi:hypothetical protein
MREVLWLKCFGGLGVGFGVVVPPRVVVLLIGVGVIR